MEYLVCQNCGTHNTDPGGNVLQYTCGNCGRGPLVRPPIPDIDTGKVIASGTVGAAIGGAMFGVAGAVIGGALGALLVWCKKGRCYTRKEKKK